MFPTVRCSFQNLNPHMKYWVLLDIVPCDNKRYRYAYHRSSWLVAGKADPPPPHRFYAHPDAPFTGEQLRKQVVSFEKVKLTNNEMDKTGQVRSWAQAQLAHFHFLCLTLPSDPCYMAGFSECPMHEWCVGAILKNCFFWSLHELYGLGLWGDPYQ